jgi:DNA invertase Pin-like site-specific DNA recombinase
MANTNAAENLQGLTLDSGWTVDERVVKDRRPALDQMIRDAKRRRFDVLVCWRLDRLGRNLKHLITFLDVSRRLA